MPGIPSKHQSQSKAVAHSLTKPLVLNQGVRKDLTFATVVKNGFQRKNKYQKWLLKNRRREINEKNVNGWKGLSFNVFESDMSWLKRAYVG